jgi:hypothetical protein
VREIGLDVLSWDELGWEAALFDHFQAMVTAIGSKVTQGKNRAARDSQVSWNACIRAARLTFC